MNAYILHCEYFNQRGEFENENISACSNENIGCLCSTLKDSYEMVQKKSMVLRSGVVNNGMSGKDKDL